MQKTYKIEIGIEEIRLVMQALDFYSRISTFQFERLEDNTDIQSYLMSKSKYPEFESEIKALKSIFGYSSGGSRGIFNSEVSDKAKIMCDMHQTIRHQLWKDSPNKVAYTTGAYPSDYCKIAKLEIPTFKIIENETTFK